jgi:hypothetical protein
VFEYDPLRVRVSDTALTCITNTFIIHVESQALRSPLESLESDSVMFLPTQIFWF